MAIELEQLQFHIVGDFSELNKAYELWEGLKKELGDVPKFEVSTGETTKKIKSATKEAAKEVERINPFKNFPELSVNADEYEENIGKNNKIVGIEQMSRLAEYSKEASDYASEFGKNINKALNLSALSDFSSALSNVVGDSFKYTGIGKTSFNYKGTGFKGIDFKLFDASSPFDRMFGNVAGLVTKGIIPPVKLVSNAFKNATQGASKFFKSIQRIALYRAIRTALKLISQGIRDGIKNLYQWSAIVDKTFKNSMDDLATSALYAKNSLGAMVAPIINAITPAVKSLSDAFVDLVNRFNEVISAFTGAELYTVADRVATTWQDTAKETEKAQKKLKKSILGFDELNVLNGKDSSTDTAPDYASMFHNEEVSQPTREFVTRIKTIFEQEGTPINLEKIRNLGGEVAIRFNTFIEGLDAKGIGKQVADVVNKGIAFVNGFLRKANFFNVGRKVGEFLESAFRNIDFKEIGATFTRIITSALDFGIGLITTPGLLGSIGKSIGEFLVGAFNEGSSWLDSYDWEQVGEDLAKGLKEFFEELKVDEVSTAIFTFLGKAFKAAFDLVGGFIKEMYPEGISLSPDDIFKAFLDLGEWVNKNIVFPFINAFTGGSLEDDLEASGGNYSQALNTGLTEGLMDVGAWIDENLWTPIENSFTTKFPEMKKDGKTTFDKFKDGAFLALYNIGEWIQTHLWNPIAVKLINAGIESKTKGANMINKFKKGIDDELKGINNWLKIKIADPIEQFFDKLFPFFNDVGEGLAEWILYGWQAGLAKMAKNFTDSFLELNKAMINLIPGMDYDTLKTQVDTTMDAYINVLERQSKPTVPSVYINGNENSYAQTQEDLASAIKDMNEILDRIDKKDTTVEVTTSSMINAFTRTNTRAGKQVVSVN